MRIWFALIFCCALVRAADPVVISGRAMGTTWRVSYRADAAAPAAKELEQKIAARLETLEQIFSTYRTGSELMRFNAQRSKEWVPVSAELITVAMLSKKITMLTGGAFNATVVPLLELWGVAPSGGGKGLPSESAIAVARAKVGDHRIATSLAPTALRKMDPEVRADYSSAAKGFAVDQVSALLATAGVQDHLVQIGGDMKAAGSTWRVGVEDPESTSDPVAVRLSLRPGMALSTSGNARNAVVRDGRRIGHIVDPRTGRPVESNVISVSVVHAECAESSALATALYVFDRERGRQLAERREMAVLYLVRDGGSLMKQPTPEFARLMISTQ